MMVRGILFDIDTVHILLIFYTLLVNAGIFIPTPVGNVSEEIFDHQVEINFKGAVFTIEKFLPILNENASVINIGAVVAHAGMPNTAEFAASKAALNSYARIAAIELAPRKIRVNSVNPGQVATPAWNKSGLSNDQLADIAAALQDRIPLKRLGKPEEIAKLVVFLASDDSSFITGAEYNIDGGVSVNTILS